MAEALWWTLSIVPIDTGSAGTVLPALPGTPNRHDDPQGREGRDACMTAGIFVAVLLL
jgi:hypothetical protein